MPLPAVTDRSFSVQVPELSDAAFTKKSLNLRDRNLDRSYHAIRRQEEPKQLYNLATPTESYKMFL
jgi:hypothetical protein